MSDLDNSDAAAPYGAPAATGAAEGDAFVGEDRAAPEELSSAADTACPPAAAGARDDAQGTDAGGAGGPVAAESRTPTPTAEPAPTASLCRRLCRGCGRDECGSCRRRSTLHGKRRRRTPMPEGRQGGEDESAAVAESIARRWRLSTLTVIEIILAGGLVALMRRHRDRVHVLRRRAA